VDFFLSPLFLSSLLFVLSSSWPGLDSSAGPWPLISFHAHQIRWHGPEFAVHVWILLLASVLLFFGLSHARSLQSPLIHFGRALGPSAKPAEQLRSKHTVRQFVVSLRVQQIRLPPVRFPGDFSTFDSCAPV
jgi:hypothetical protein